MRIKVFVILFFTLFSQAQSLDEMMNEMMKEQRKMFEMLEKDQTAFDDYVNKMFDRMRGNAFGTFSNDTFEINRKGLKTYWQEDEKSRTLVVEFKNEDDKIDIKIEQGMIRFEGVHVNEVKNEKGEVVSSSRSSFQRSVGIPADVDSENPDMKKVKDKILITFKKINKVQKNQIKNQKRKVIIPSGGKNDI